MANAVKGQVGFSIDGQDFVLVFDHEAIASFEDAADVSIFDAFDALGRMEQEGRRPKLSMMGQLLRAGLERFHPEIDLSQCMKWAMDPVVMEVFSDAAVATFPAADEGDVGNAPKAAPKKRRNSTGKK